MIAFLINEIDICGGTHKQFLKLLDYTSCRGLKFVVVTRRLDLSSTYPGFKKYSDRIRVFTERNNHTGHFLKDKVNWILNKLKLRYLVRGCSSVNIHDNGWTFDLPAFIGKKVIWQINDLPGWYAQGVHSSLIHTSDFEIMRERTKRNLKFVSDITVNVSKNAERVRRCMGRDAHVFYCGIEPVGVIHNIEDTIHRFVSRKINILSSGVFFPYRNYESQVKMVKALINRGYDVHLNIIGRLLDLEYANSIRRMISNYGLDEKISILGQVDDNKFRQLHYSSDIFVFVNVDQSWGLAVFEAMSCGLPVVVSNSVGATEILTDRENAIFVDPMNPDKIVDEVVGLIEDKDFYLRISTNSVDFCSHWTWDEVYCSKMIDLLTAKA